MYRCVLVTMALGACAGSTRGASTEAPSSRATELASVAPACDGVTLRAFDPGLPGREVVSVDERRQHDAPLTREHARPCELAEDDDTCLARAKRDVIAADPDATITEAAMNGEPDGWQAQLEVDGQLRPLRVPQEADVVAEARRLQSLGHRVVPREGRRVYREDSRRAIVSYAVPIGQTPSRVQWEATLRWPLPPDVPAALERLQEQVERAGLVVVRYEVGVDGVLAVVACP
jgi:hypothetical protein